MIRIFLLAISLCWSGALFAQVSATCQGKFMNPLTDICWSCVMPIKIGSAAIMSMGQEDISGPGGSPLCVCGTGLDTKIGIKMSFWEPARTVEIVRSAWCFPSLGGIHLDPGFYAPDHGRTPKSQGTLLPTSFYQAHFYINPILFWLEILMDNSCLEQNVFDLAYMTELDPLWNDSNLTFILNPDVSLFTGLPAKAACAGDCVAATAGFPYSELFWCAGCQGGMYPLDGWVPAHVGGVQASTLLTQRITNKLHRQGMVWAASGSSGLCGYYPQVIMDKRNYKMQMLYPVRNTSKVDGKCCQPFGRTTTIWGSMKEFPYRGEDFSYMLFRKRDCCQGAIGIMDVF